MRKATLLVFCLGMLVGCVKPPPSPSHQEQCADWNTKAFAKAASLSLWHACLADGADQNARDENGYAPLHFAAATSG